MLIYSMSVSVDGFIADREGGFGWGVPDEELFRFHLARVRELGCHLCGRKLYETMLVWETDPSLRDTELHAAFADVWCALPKVVFSRTLDSVQGNARLAEGSVEEEVAAALAATDKDIEMVGLVGVPDGVRPHPRENREVSVVALDPADRADSDLWEQVLALQVTCTNRSDSSAPSASPASASRRPITEPAREGVGRAGWSIAISHPTSQPPAAPTNFFRQQAGRS